MVALSARDVAEYFISLANEEEGDVMTNLKLQKLVYYAQGFHLAIYDRALFSEDIEAWQHGPVVPSLYHHYKIHENGAIPMPTELDLAKFDVQTRKLLDEVWEIYGQYSAIGLRNLTHEEPPWKDTPQGTVIPHPAMKEFFKTQLVNG